MPTTEGELQKAAAMETETESTRKKAWSYFVRLLDDRWRIPGTEIRFELDSLLGLGFEWGPKIFR